MTTTPTKTETTPQSGASDIGRPPLILFGFSPWKSFVDNWFPDNEVHRLERRIHPTEFNAVWAPLILADRRTRVMVWGYKIEPYLRRFCDAYGVPVSYVEDGFLRSVGLGAQKVPPLSITIDSQAAYFDARYPTDLENLLNTTVFTPELRDRAKEAMRKIIDLRLSKYNFRKNELPQAQGEAGVKNILVIGQVEDDASIQYGCNREINNNDLVWIARLENMGHNILYKPHPDVFLKARAALSNPADVEHICTIVDGNMSLADCLEFADHVYTITSLAGFEALMRGISVTTVGCPFYSGWGLTDDRQPNDRRGRKLTIEELFAVAYIIYPKYIHPYMKQEIEIEQAIDVLSDLRDLTPAAVDPTTEITARVVSAIATLESLKIDLRRATGLIPVQPKVMAEPKVEKPADPKLAKKPAPVPAKPALALTKTGAKVK